MPFTLLPTILVAWVRGDLAAMWEGDSYKVTPVLRCRVPVQCVV